MIALTLAACVLVPDGKKDPATTSVTTDSSLGPTLAFESFGDRTNQSGRLKVTFDLAGDVASFQITAESKQYPSVAEVIDPDGNTVLYWEDWWSAKESLTGAIFGFSQPMAFDWPVRDVDGPLTPGTWTVWLDVTNYSGFYLPDEAVDITIARKTDADLTKASIGVQIVWADGVDDDEDIVTAVHDAVERWRRVWDQHGITLVERYETSNLDPNLPFAYQGDASVKRLADKKLDNELQLIVGESVASDDYVYGVAGGIPGTILSSETTFVVISWLAHAGRDGAFDDDESRLMGETMAHEIGHYMGLFHPVEFGFNHWDALEDTVDCGARGRCEEELGKNLMFPYSICTFQSCVPTNELSDQQRSVAHQYIGAL